MPYSSPDRVRSAAAGGTVLGMTSMRVALVDHQRVFAEALADQLAREDDVIVVGTATTAEDARALVAGGDIDVLALEFDLPGVDGLELGRQALRQRPGIALVVVTGEVDRPRVLEAVRSGVLAWVPKDSSYVELLSALRTAARGETQFPAAVFKLVVDENDVTRVREASVRAIARLTPRETDVLRCLMEGLTRRQSADHLGLSTNTVRTHIQSILHKLRLHSALTAVAVARRAGLDAAEHRASPDDTTPPDDVPRPHTRAGFGGPRTPLR